MDVSLRLKLRNNSPYEIYLIGSLVKGEYTAMDLGIEPDNALTEYISEKHSEDIVESLVKLVRR